MADTATDDTLIKEVGTWIRENQSTLGAVFWLIALGLPMTPWGDTNLGYILIASATLLTIALIIFTIWKFSAGVRYAPNTVRHSYSKEERRIRYSMTGGFCLTCVLSILFVMQIAGGFKGLPRAEVSYVDSWNYLVASGTGVINTETLLGYENRFHLIVVCRWPDFTVPPLEDTRIQKSRFLTITGSRITIEIPLSEEFLAFRKTGLEFYLLLVPHRIVHEDIAKMSDITKNGGMILARRQAAAGRTVILKGNADS